MTTFVFIIQTAWLSDVDFAVKATDIKAAYELVEAEWPTKNGHRVFFQYKY